MLILSFALTYSHTRASIHIHTNVLKYSLTLSLSHILTHTHTHTHIHKHIHKHTRF